MFALNLSADGRILSAAIYPKGNPPDAVLVETIPEGDVSEYLYVNGEFIHNPIHEQTEPDATPSLENRVTTLEEALEMILSGVTE